MNGDVPDGRQNGSICSGSGFGDEASRESMSSPPLPGPSAATTPSRRSMAALKKVLDGDRCLARYLYIALHADQLCWCGLVCGYVCVSLCVHMGMCVCVCGCVGGGEMKHFRAET